MQMLETLSGAASQALSFLFSDIEPITVPRLTKQAKLLTSELQGYACLG